MRLVVNTPTPRSGADPGRRRDPPRGDRGGHPVPDRDRDGGRGGRGAGPGDRGDDRGCALARRSGCRRFGRSPRPARSGIAPRPAPRAPPRCARAPAALRPARLAPPGIRPRVPPASRVPRPALRPRPRCVAPTRVAPAASDARVGSGASVTWRARRPHRQRAALGAPRDALHRARPAAAEPTRTTLTPSNRLG